MLIKICDVNRRTSMIKAVPTMSNLKLKGQQYFGIIVSRIVLESDGVDVLEDEVVELCAEEKLTLMLLSLDQHWASPNQIIQIYQPEQITNTETVHEVIELGKILVPTEINEPCPEQSPSSSKTTLIIETPSQTDQTSLTPKRKAEELDANDSLLENVETVGNNSKQDDTNAQVVTKKTRKENKSGTTVYELKNFSVNWNEISPDIIEQLNECYENKEVLCSTTYNRLSSQIVEQIRKISPTIPFSVFSRVAFQAAKKFPILQEDDGDGNILGDGSSGFADKLRSSNNYIKKVLSKKQTVVKLAKNKSIAGVDANYQKCSKSMCTKNDIVAIKRCTPDNLSEDLLKNTLGYIRHKLDNTVVSSLVTELPIIRSSKLLNHHFTAATTINPTILKQIFCEKRDILVKATKKNKKQTDPDTLTDLEIFQRISNYLGEQFESMFKSYEEGTELKDVNTNNPYPTILSFDDGDNNCSYYIQLDNTIVTEKVETIVDAVQLSVVIYYVYYIKYPQFLSRTLEFFQTYLFKLITKESRVTMKKGNNPRKGVFALINRISKIVKLSNIVPRSPEPGLWIICL